MKAPSFPLSKLNLLLFLASSFLQSAFYWALTIFISKAYGIKVLGEYSYTIALLTPLTVLGGLQLKSYFLTKNSSHLRGQIKWLRFSFPMFLILLTFLGLRFFEPWILTLFALIALIKWGELWSDLAHAIWQMDEGLRSVNKSIFLRYTVLSVSLALAWFMKASLEQMFVMLALTSLLIALLDHFMSGLHKIPMERMGSKGTFLTTLSLSMSSLFTALLVNIPRYQLKEFHSVEEVGVFSILFYYYVIPSMVINYSCQGLLRNFGEVSKGRSTLKIILGGVTLTSIIYFTILYSLGETITTSLYGNTPEWNLKLVTLITMSFFLGGISSILHYALMGRNIYNIQLKTNLAAAFVTFILGFTLIPLSGISGAFISFLSGLLVQSTVYIFAFAKLKK